MTSMTVQQNLRATEFKQVVQGRQELSGQPVSPATTASGTTEATADLGQTMAPPAKADANLQDPVIITLNGMQAQLQGDSYRVDLFNTGVPVQLPNLTGQQFYLAFAVDDHSRTASAAVLAADQVDGKDSPDIHVDLLV